MTPATSRPRASQRRPGSRTALHRTGSRNSRRSGRKRGSWRTRAIWSAVLVVFCLFAWGYLARHFAPTSNASLTHFDTIIVLGDPADADGNPTPTELARVTESVREYERGAAPRLIFTGAAVHNQFVEARVMARTAEAQGIPASAIYVEPDARDTFQNACYSARMMKARGWSSAEVISSAWHLRRAGLIFSRLPIEWRAHAAPALEPESAIHRDAVALEETLKTVRYLVWGRPIEQCEP